MGSIREQALEAKVELLITQLALLQSRVEQLEKHGRVAQLTDPSTGLQVEPGHKQPFDSWRPE